MMLHLLADFDVLPVQLLQLVIKGRGAGVGVDQGSDLRLQLDDFFADGIGSCL